MAALLFRSTRLVTMVSLFTVEGSPCRDLFCRARDIYIYFFLKCVHMHICKYLCVCKYVYVYVYVGVDVYVYV